MPLLNRNASQTHALHIQEKHIVKPLVQQNAALELCDKHIKKHPDKITCPATCPYLRSEPTRLCQFKCVPASACNADNPLASYANPNTMRCETCGVAGCYHCGSSRDVCETCQDGFELKNGICLSESRHYWRAFFAVLIALAIFLIYYLFALFYLRTSRNEVALEAGLAFRKHSVIHVKDSQGELRKVSLSRNLMSDKFDCCGPGLMLHFRWMGAIFVWTIFATVLFGVVGLLFTERLGVMHKPNTQRSYEACEENVQFQKDEYNKNEAIFTSCTVILYIVTSIGCFWLAADQRRAFKQQDANNITMKDFAMVATGFPSFEGTEKVEKDFLSFLKAQRQLKECDIVGVSVCWDFRDKQQHVYDQVRREFDYACGEHDADYAAQTFAAKQFEIAKTESNARKCCVSCDPKMRFVDAIFGIGQCPCATSEPAEVPEDEDVKSLLSDMQSTGTVYITFGSTADVQEAYNRCQENPLVYPGTDGKSHLIELSTTDAEPLTVLWQGYGTEHFRFLMSIVVGCLIVFVSVLLLDAFFYTPYVMYILAYSNVAGMSQGGVMSGLLLGMLITVCNQCIYLIIGAVADFCGWTNSDAKQTFYCVKYTFAVLFNTLIDLSTVLILAQGFSVDMAMQMEVADDSAMSAKAVSESPNLQKALYVQLVAYIFPSCTLLPFLIEPFATTFVPFWIGKALVRTRREVTIQDAEEFLQNPPYDLSRYGDILVNVMLCCIMLVFTYSDLWLLFFYMILSLVVIYAWDHVRVLRFTSKFMISTSSMDDAVMYMMAFPPAVIAMCLVFKAYGASNRGFLDDISKAPRGEFLATMNRSNVVTYMLCAFLAHVVLHWILLRFAVIPSTREQSVEESEGSSRDPQTGLPWAYANIGRNRPANYFNTNPVNCLRSKYIYNDDPPCIYYRVGKEHLIKRNHKIGIEFEAHHHEKSPRMEATGTLRRLQTSVTDFAKGV